METLTTENIIEVPTSFGRMHLNEEQLVDAFVQVWSDGWIDTGELDEGIGQHGFDIRKDVFEVEELKDVVNSDKWDELEDYIRDNYPLKVQIEARVSFFHTTIVEVLNKDELDYKASELISEDVYNEHSIDVERYDIEINHIENL